MSDSLSVAIRSYEILTHLRAAVAKHDPAGQGQSEKRQKLQVDISYCLEKFTIWMGELGILEDAETDLPLDKGVRAYMHEHLGQISEALEEVDRLWKKDANDIEGPSPTEDAANLQQPEEDRVPYPPSTITQAITYLFRASSLATQQANSSLRRHAKELSLEPVNLGAQFAEHIAREYPKLRATKTLDRLADAMSVRRQAIEHIKKRRNISSPEVSRTTGAGTSQQRLELFKLSDLSPPGKPFRCPHCYTILQFDNEGTWRLHALQDLKPYLCTVGSSRECDKLSFASEERWFEHEIIHHRATYACVLCGTRGSSKVIEQHLKAKHDMIQLDSDDLRKLVKMGQVPLERVKPDDCPFCNDLAVESDRKQPDDKSWVSPRALRLHVAAHLEELASLSALGDLNTSSQENLLDEEQSSKAKSKPSRSDEKATSPRSEFTAPSSFAEERGSHLLEPTSNTVDWDIGVLGGTGHFCWSCVRICPSQPHLDLKER